MHETSALDWTLFNQTLAKAQNVVIVGHVRPDGDTIGSSLAMKRALESLGKKIVAFNAFATPSSLKFLDPNGEIRKLEEATQEELDFAAKVDVTISIDVSSWAQLGACGEFFKTNEGGVKVIIDHHAVADQIGDVRFVDSNADSAGSLVFDAIKSLGVPLTPEIAFPLFVAISSDTGWFRFGSTSPSTLRRAAELVESGVRVDEVYKLLYEQESYGRFKLLGAAVANGVKFLGGKGVFSALSQRDFEAAGAEPADSEDLVNEPLSVAGMEVSVFAIEQKDGSVKASFRSRCDLDCAKLAREFGGGGHFHAAGASPKGDLETASQALIAKTTEYYDALKEK